MSLVASHDGWVGTHGLTHTRLTGPVAGRAAADGRRRSGRHERACPAPLRTGDDPHPACRASASTCASTCIPMSMPTLDLGGSAVSMALKSGEIWVFRHTGGRSLALEPSVYLEKGRLKPRATRQIVLAGTCSIHRRGSAGPWRRHRILRSRSATLTATIFRPDLRPQPAREDRCPISFPSAAR